MRRDLLVLAFGLLCVGAAHARNATGKVDPKPFPALESCVQKAGGTPFHISTNVTKAAPGATYCFSFSTAAPVNAEAPCGMATVLERIQLWASYALRSKVTAARIRDNKGEKIVFGSWAKKGNSQDELVFSKLNWSPEYILASKPRLCITLAAAISLDDLCLGPNGTCVFGLYSSGAKGSKCCPVYSVPALAV